MPPSLCHHLSIICAATMFGLVSFNVAPMRLVATEISNYEFQYQLGLAGKVKLGSWSPIFVQVPENARPTLFEVDAPDGNGVPVTFQGTLIHDAGNHYQCWFKLGRRFGKITVRLYDESGAWLSSATYDISNQADVKVVDSTVPQVLVIEPTKNIADAIKSIETQMFGQACEVISIGEARQMPASQLPLQGIEIIYLTASDLELVQGLTLVQWQALRSWIADGGKLVWSVGSNGPRLFAEAAAWRHLLPGTFAGLFEIAKSSPIESYTKSRQKLIPRDSGAITATKIIDPVGIADFSISGHPIVIRMPQGFGQVIFSAIDFDDQYLVSWSGLKAFLLKATFGRLNLNRVAGEESTSRGVVRVGFQDILGQLQLPLESFSKVFFLNFTVVALLIGLFVILVGPADYFLLKKWCCCMELTWLTFSISVVAFAGLAVYLFHATKPDHIQINQLEIIDIDQTDGRIRGSLWTNVYSPENHKLSAASENQNALGIDTSISTVCWMGVPGSSLGGMSSYANSGLVTPGYVCQFFPESTERCLVERIPIRVSSTQSLHSRYRAESPFDIRSKLFLNTRTNRLQGTITNPFEFQLHDCRLIFENWVYLLQRPLDPGETIDVYSELKERTVSSYFSRRAEQDSDKGGETPWNPEEADLERIAELMMFFDAASGRQYTGLIHAFQPYVDLSELLYLDRAILFGKTNQIGTKLQWGPNTSHVQYDQVRTFVRLVFPVDRN